MASGAVEQAKPRKELLAGSVNEEEREVVEQAMRRAAFPNMSVFVRETMLQRAAEILAPKRRGDRRDAAA